MKSRLLYLGGATATILCVILLNENKCLAQTLVESYTDSAFIQIPACSYQTVPLQTCVEREDDGNCEIQRNIICTPRPKRKKKRRCKREADASPEPDPEPLSVRSNGNNARCSRLSDRTCRSRCRARAGLGRDRVLTKCKVGVVCADNRDPRTCKEEQLCYEKPVAAGDRDFGEEQDPSYTRCIIEDCLSCERSRPRDREVIVDSDYSVQRFKNKQLLRRDQEVEDRLLQQRRKQQRLREQLEDEERRLLLQAQKQQRLQEQRILLQEQEQNLLLQAQKRQQLQEQQLLLEEEEERLRQRQQRLRDQKLRYQQQQRQSLPRQRKKTKQRNRVCEEYYEDDGVEEDCQLVEERVCSRVQECQTIEETQLVCQETLNVPATLLQEAVDRAVAGK